MTPTGTSNGERRRARALLDSKKRPTAFFASTDVVATHIYRAAADLGLRIPDDLSVAGFGNLDFSALLMPPLATMEQHPYELGREAARLALARINQEDGLGGPVTRRIEATWMERASVASPL